MEIAQTRHIYVGFSKSHSPGLISKLQMRVFRIDFSHMYVCFELGGVKLVAHAIGKGVVVQLFSEFKKRRTPMHEFLIRLLPQQFNDFLLKAFSTVGQKYGTREMLGCGVMAVFGLSKNPFENKEETYCSEYGRVLLSAAGVLLGEQEDLPPAKAFILMLALAKNAPHIEKIK